MIKIKSILSHHHVLFLVLLCICLWFIYGVQFEKDALLNFDDDVVIKNMQYVISLKDYISEWKAGRIYDLQPVRDLVTWIDYRILYFFNLSVFHLTNVLIWAVTLLGLYCLIIRAQFLSQLQAQFSILILACNPLYLSSVSWLTARKHLLAACFIVWATYHFYIWLLEKRSGLRLFIFTCLYVLAIYSQPIVILWPVFLGMVLILNKKIRYWPAIAPVVIIMLVTAYLNFNYYSSPNYLRLSYGIPKYSQLYNQILPVRLFALGRYLFQIICPYWTSISFYDLRSWRNLTGIFLIPVVFYLLIKTCSRRNFLIGVSFFLLMILPMLVKMTQIFGMDTYVITASFGIYFLIMEASKVCFTKFRSLSIITCSVLLIAFLLVGRNRAEAWDSDINVFGQAREIESGDFPEEKYIYALLVANRVREAVWYAQDFLLRSPGDELAQGVIGFAISHDPDLDLPTKLKKLDDTRYVDSVTLNFAAQLEFESGHFLRSEKLLLYILTQETWYRAVITNPEGFAARIFVSCEFQSKLDCESKKDKVKLKVNKSWKDAKFLEEKALWTKQAEVFKAKKKEPNQSAPF